MTRAIIQLMFLCAVNVNAVQFTAPTNEVELKQRLKELHEEYRPYLRSFPQKVEGRKRTSLNGQWQFTFEVKDPPKQDTPAPPAPMWYTVAFDDTHWETTRVPEWRYRTVGYDNAYDLTTKDKTILIGDRRNTSQICWYRRVFSSGKPTTAQRQWLCFDGVDWEAQV